MTNSMIFVNLSVKDLERTNAFFTALGYKFNPEYSDKNATCMVVSEAIFVMLLAEPFFQTFTPNTICDATKSTEAIVCLMCETREDVDAIVKKAVKAGGKTYNEPKDHGFMYQHGFQDPDGHIWEYVAMAAAK
ncbi:MAG TPA: VOC family protein [Caulifigura sp.]|nr:VOC family protein [Caulifigura sp.]